jgi:hypothetical protein
MPQRPLAGSRWRPDAINEQPAIALHGGPGSADLLADEQAAESFISARRRRTSDLVKKVPFFEV